jgi:cytidylate kinase
MSGPFLIVLDGPAGVGKSVTARRLAASLGLAYLDTGAMFRILALLLGNQREAMPPVSPSRPRRAKPGYVPGEASFPDGPDLEAFLAGFSFSLQGSGAETVLLCNGRPAGGEIRTEEAGMLASKIGRLAGVRAFLKAEQQRLGTAFSLVAEGRDMGTEVFPGASCKIFLDARPEVRALRRYRQLLETGQEADYAEILLRLKERDAEDRNRPLAPLKPAPDALLVDTSDLGFEEVFSLCRQAALRAGFPA